MPFFLEKVAPTKPPKPAEKLVPVSFKGGRADSNSVHAASHAAANAFVPQVKGKYPWASNNKNKFPVIVWYKFPVYLKVAKVSFSSRRDHLVNQSPTQFEVVGSNDCKTWKAVAKYTTKFTKANEQKTFNIAKKDRKTFSCWGIKVNKVTSGPHAAIQNMKMLREPGRLKKVTPPPPPKENLTPVSFKGGRADANSVHAASHAAANAFVPEVPGKYPWASNSKNKFPVIVWYKFPVYLKVAKVSFSSRRFCCVNQSPTQFEVVGSNDCKTWKAVARYTTKFTKANEQKTFNIAKKDRKTFSCWGIKVNKVTSGPHAAIQNMKMLREPGPLKKVPPPPPPKSKIYAMPFKGGRADATSIHAASHAAADAFIPQAPGKYPWANNAKSKFPVSVWYKFPVYVKVARVKFSSRRDCCLNQSPTRFQVIGSNDCKTWKAVATFTAKFTKPNEEKSFTIPKSRRRTLSCWGIKVYKVTSGPYAAIQNMKIWREPGPLKKVPPPPAPQPKIPPGYKKGGDGYYYKYHGERKNWNDAQNICKREGGNLAIIWNQKTRDVVRGFMANGWIGLSDQWHEGRWQTPLRGNAPYTSWNRGEPNNAGNEDCTIQHSNKVWNDLNCGSKQPFICQFKAGNEGMINSFNY